MKDRTMISARTSLPWVVFVVLAGLGAAVLAQPTTGVAQPEQVVCDWQPSLEHQGGEVCLRPVAATPEPTAEPTATVQPAPTATEVPPAPTATAVPPTPTNPPTGGPMFLETFDSADSLGRFDWLLHHDIPFGGSPSTWPGDHDLSCGPPTTTRTIHSPVTERHTPPTTDVGETAYWCAPAGFGSGHLMTSINTTGYSHLDFSPSQTFTDPDTVCWDQNQNDLGRKWTQVTIVTEARFQANGQRLDYVLPRLQGGPGSGGIRLQSGDFLFSTQDGATELYVGQQRTHQDFRGFVVDQKPPRFRTCLLDQGDGTIRIELERANGQIEVRIAPGSFPAGQVRVIFQDVTYNATKNAANVPAPFTWHWDNLLIDG